MLAFFDNQIRILADNIQLSQLPLWYWLTVFIAVGLVIGSFINVVVYRLPIMWQRFEDNFVAEKQKLPPVHIDSFNLSQPRSRCPECGALIRWFDNIPVLSFLWLKGACRYCRSPISMQYPFVELVSGLLAGGCILWYGIGIHAVIFTILLLTLWTLTLIDWNTQILPDDITLPLLWIGLLVNLWGIIVPLNESVLGAMLGYSVLWIVNALFRSIRGIDGMGYGDFKLLAALGAWFGWQAIPCIILISSLTGTVFSLIMMAFKGLGRQERFAFGPFIALAGLVLVVLYRQPHWWRITQIWNP